VFDQYACKILLRELDQKSISQGPDGARSWYVVEQFDYTRLKLFFLSTLWRMSVSRRPAFAKVDLGPYEGKFRDMLANRDPGDAGVFPVFLTRYTDDVGMGSMIGTHRQRMHGVNVFHMGLPGYVATIKVDKRPLPLPIGRLVLQPGHPLIVGLRQMNTGTEWPSIKRIISNSVKDRKLT
jgi:hypothetical protein